MSQASQHPLFVHLMPKEKFSKGFIMFTNDAFPDVDVRFVLYGEEMTGYETPDASNVYFADSAKAVLSDSECRSLLRNCDAIVLNWVNWRFALCLLPFLYKTWLMFWGGDIYSVTSAKQPAGTKGRASRYIKALLVRRAGGVITLIPGDLAEVEKLSKKHGPWYLGKMCGLTAASAEEAANGHTMVDRADKPLRILVGNSATPTNRHIPVLEALSKYRNEDIEVCAPLSYGDDAYRAEVISAGKRLLGEKFVPMVDYVDIEQYQQFLSTVSVGVFNHNRQQGMGNINGLMRLGAKVFLSKDSPMWDDFAKEGRVFYATEDLPNLPFEDFAVEDKKGAAVNSTLLDPRKTYEKGVQLWTNIYASIGKR